MRHLLNTLFVTSEDAYLSLDGENVVVSREKKGGGEIPVAQFVRNHQLFLCRRYARADGSLRKTRCGTHILYATGEVFGPHGRN